MFQFTLRNLMIATVFIALSATVLGDLVRRPHFGWPPVEHYLVIGASVGAAWGSLRRGWHGILPGAGRGVLVVFIWLLLAIVLC